MSKLSVVLFVALLFFGVFSHASAQTKEEKPATASVTGRITVDKQPLPGVTVSLEMAMNQGMLSSQRRPITAKTDADGRYRLMGIAAGQYLIAPRALAYVMPTEAMSARAGKNVTLSDGEQIEGVDFELIKGGVITGKITDHLNRPVIAQRVTLNHVKTGNQQFANTFYSQNYYMFETDDRGIYRLYGVPAGRYILSVGTGRDGRSFNMSRSPNYYPLTFYPGVASEAEAKIIEVTEGSEATEIDIKLPSPEKTYEAKGRIVDASTGTPLIGVHYGYGTLMGEEKRFGTVGMAGERTNAQGEFLIQGLAPGSYAVFTATDPGSEYYTEPLKFEVFTNDVEGLEVKAYRGASISGVVVIEGVTDPAILKQVANVRVNAYPQVATSQSMPMPVPMSTMAQTTNTDGTFRVKGLRPGKHRISAVASVPNLPLMLSRIEREGVEMRDIDLTAGEQVTGIKVVMAHGSGVIRGEVQVVNGTLPPNTQLMVTIMRRNPGATTGGRSAQVDARGKFVMEGLLPGEYELTAYPMMRTPDPSYRSPRPAPQKVTVGAGETPVTLTLDLGQKKEGQQ